MANFFSYKLKQSDLQAIFGPASVEQPELSSSPHLQGPHHPFDFAQRLYSLESLQPYGFRVPRVDLMEPYSLQWFLDIENQRHSKHGKWIPKLLEFSKHSGETLLGLGHGLGTDWVQYAQHGASVMVCSQALPQLELVQRNFDLRGLSGRFIGANPTCLPLPANSIDVVCISSLHHGIDDPDRLIPEVYRVLKPGGKVLAVAPAYFDVDYWVRNMFFWNRWLKPNRGKNPLRCKLRLSANQFHGLFRQFTDIRIRKRQLRRIEVPVVWQWIPLPILARLMGRVLVLKAFKPLNANLTTVELKK